MRPYIREPTAESTEEPAMNSKATTPALRRARENKRKVPVHEAQASLGPVSSFHSLQRKTVVLHSRLDKARCPLHASPLCPPLAGANATLRPEQRQSPPRGSKPAPPSPPPQTPIMQRRNRQTEKSGSTIRSRGHTHILFGPDGPSHASIGAHMRGTEHERDPNSPVLLPMLPS